MEEFSCCGKFTRIAFIRNLVHNQFTSIADLNETANEFRVSTLFKKCPNWNVVCSDPYFSAFGPNT